MSAPVFPTSPSLAPIVAQPVFQPVVFNPSNPGFERAPSLNNQQATAQPSLVGCAGREDVSAICRFNNLECCTERRSATVFVPNGNDNALCYEAREAFDSLSADWTDKECDKVRLDVEMSGGIGCACTTEPEKDLTCAQRDLDYQVCDFDVPPSRLVDCCSPHDSLLVNTVEGTLVVKCAVANATLYGDDSVPWSDSKCQAVRDAILDHALESQGCPCPTTPPPAVLTNPPTPAPPTAMPSPTPSLTMQPTMTWVPSRTPSKSNAPTTTTTTIETPRSPMSADDATSDAPPSSGARSSSGRWRLLLLVGTALLLALTL
mmetsp:Transcript_21431/g.35471  ORF Transcript_21431/g.35471 Transcript_21431/m.35471 type:complete len:318 (-) Transcript_21431:252-1205(-)